MRDASAVRHACIALQHLGPSKQLLPPEKLQTAHLSLVSVLLYNVLPEDDWYTAAEASLKAIFALHPSPVVLCTALLKKLGKTAFLTSGICHYDLPLH